MSLSKVKIQNRLSPFLLQTISSEILGLLTEDDFLDIFNSVAADLNDSAQIHIERYFKKTGADNSEDSNYTNYLLDGEIRKIISFKLEDINWENISYAFISDRIILDKKSTNAQMTILYLRDVEDVSADTDVIDLPESLFEDYLSLLRLRIVQEYGQTPSQTYEEALAYYTEKAQEKLSRTKVNHSKVRREWMQQTGDDFIYMITDKEIGIENFILGQDGNYTHVDI